MRYTSHRNITVASTCGLSVELKKGEPTLCPPGMHDELLALGCVPEDEMPEPEVGAEPVAPSSLPDRHAALCRAFEAVALRNRRNDFNAVGVLHGAVLAKELGYPVDAKERDAAWAKWQNETAPA